MFQGSHRYDLEADVRHFIEKADMVITCQGAEEGNCLGENEGNRQTSSDSLQPYCSVNQRVCLEVLNH